MGRFHQTHIVQGLEAWKAAIMQQMPIPQNIDGLWAALYDEVVNLHAYWIIFEQLFGKSQARHDLLYASAGHLFLVVEDALGTDVQLALSKLSDPPTMRGFQNATLPRLFDEIDCPIGWLHVVR
jgi:AbiU2